MNNNINLSHVWAAITGTIVLVVGIFFPGLQDAVHNDLILVGALVASVFGGHVLGQAHASLKGRGTV